MLTTDDLKSIRETLRPDFDALGTRIDDLEGTMNIKFDAVHQHFEEEIGKVRNEMVTKDYLDRKLAPINGKINVLVDVLHKNRTISDEERDIVRVQA